MSCNGSSNCTCGCCAGISVQTPQRELNSPGLPAISYRTGTWASFKESMLANLSNSNYPALAGLKSRDDDDFTIAFLDATSVMLDILTFYQERLANESYLRTATQLQSLVELSRLIGYQPAPGVSAFAYVAFTLKTTPGAIPNPSTPAITIPQGSQIQSVPAQGQKPQTFETSAAIQAKPDWNALPVMSAAPWIPPGAGGVYLAGTSTQLKIGDSILILGVEREQWQPSSTPSEQWQVMILNEVTPDNVRNLTYVAWDGPFSHESSTINPPPWTSTSAKIFAFRQKCGLFGNNAPDPRLFVVQPAQQPPATPQPSLPSLINTSTDPWSWNSYQIPATNQIDLDATYSKIAEGSWFALISKTIKSDFVFVGEFFINFSDPFFAPTSLTPSPVTFTAVPTYLAQLFMVTRATTVSQASFAMSAKVTELTPDYIDSNLQTNFPLNSSEVWAQTDELEIAPQPLDYPLYGKVLDLATLRPDLSGATVVAIFGNRQKIAVADAISNLTFVPSDGTSQPLQLNPGDVVTIVDPTPLPSFANWNSTLQNPLIVEDSNGRVGTIQSTTSAPVSLANFTLQLSSSSDPVFSEYALVAPPIITVTKPYPHTQITLQSSLANCYDRNSTTVNANVAAATHGQSVSEVMGSGSASTPNQTFTLKQSPLTFVQATTPTGYQSTLEVLVNGVEWTQVPTLYDQSSSAQVYSTLNEFDSTTNVLGGDGVEGSTFPTGTNNLQANYRVGSGSAGNVATGALTTLLDRPLGVSGVTNPEAATGGQDPQSITGIRVNAPQTVLTLGRAVSITDYQNFAATYAGIANAYAIWIPSGPARGVFLTVAGVGGTAVPAGSNTLTQLVASLQSYGNPLIPIFPVTFNETLFGLTASIAYASGVDIPSTKAQVFATLYETYSFAEQNFGQGVSIDQISALIQGVPGVVAVNVTALFTVATSSAGDLASMPGGFNAANLGIWQSSPVNLRSDYNVNVVRICPYIPVPSTQGFPYAAEILVLDPDPTQVTLGVMS